MTLATVSPDGHPDARMVLLKDVGDRGFVFYTNLESPKARALSHDARAALCFHWKALNRQVRVRGRVEQVDNAEADAYFATRPRLSQISAWASRQSQPMRDYFELETAVARTAPRFGISPIPRPAFWSGYRLCPAEIEFWTQKPFRRHERILYSRRTDGWDLKWLYP